MNNTLEMQAPSNITYGRGYAYCLQYHIVWATKYRKAVLCGSIETDLKDLLLKYAAEQGIKICAMEVMPDHVHLLVETKPQCKPSDAVKILKGSTAWHLFKLHPELKQQLWGGNLWNPSYFGYMTFRVFFKEAVADFNLCVCHCFYANSMCASCRNIFQANFSIQ